MVVRAVRRPEPSAGRISTSCPISSGGIVNHQGTDVAADVEQHSPLTGEPVVGLDRGQHHDAFVVPGVVW